MVLLTAQGLQLNKEFATPDRVPRTGSGGDEREDGYHEADSGSDSEFDPGGDDVDTGQDEDSFEEENVEESHNAFVDQDYSEDEDLEEDESESEDNYSEDDDVTEREESISEDDLDEESSGETTDCDERISVAMQNISFMSPLCTVQVDGDDDLCLG